MTSVRKAAASQEVTNGTPPMTDGGERLEMGCKSSARLHYGEAKAGAGCLLPSGPVPIPSAKPASEGPEPHLQVSWVVLLCRTKSAHSQIIQKLGSVSKDVHQPAIQISTNGSHWGQNIKETSPGRLRGVKKWPAKNAL